MEARLTQIEGQYCWRRFSIVSHVRLRRTRPIYFIVDGRTVRAYEAVLTRMDNALCLAGSWFIKRDSKPRNNNERRLLFTIKWTSDSED